MPAVARKDDLVQSPTGTGTQCASPVATKVDEVNSAEVYVNDILAVVSGNKIAPHTKKGCSPDVSTLDKYSPNVYIGGKNVGRKDDEYATGTDEANIIKEGSPNVFANG
jgi:hypothetical protein